MIMQLNNKNNAVIVYQSNSLHGAIRTPSDKSISHRALILGALCLGETTIKNLLPVSYTHLTLPTILRV